jgi:hypothetical protein
LTIRVRIAAMRASVNLTLLCCYLLSSLVPVLIIVLELELVLVLDFFWRGMWVRFCRSSFLGPEAF